MLLEIRPILQHSKMHMLHLKTGILCQSIILNSRQKNEETAGKGRPYVKLYCSLETNGYTGSFISPILSHVMQK